MQRLITAVLGYARAGHAPACIQTADLGELAGLALTDLDQALDGATVIVPAVLPKLDGDPVLIRQLLQNLIGNALKYRHPAHPCHIELAAGQHRGAWLISVADNGIGIPADQRARVFEMVARVDEKAGSGHGVGLSTCQRIVERHGGKIRATATPGGGTTITFTVPVCAA